MGMKVYELQTDILIDPNKSVAFVLIITDNDQNKIFLNYWTNLMQENIKVTTLRWECQHVCWRCDFIRHCPDKLKRIKTWLYMLIYVFLSYICPDTVA